MGQKLDYLRESPSQTAGPYVHIGCTPNFTGIAVYGGDLGTAMKTGPVQGQEIVIKGTVFDGTGTPLRDAMIEIWQPDAAGLFPSANETRGKADPNFSGWGRSPGDMETGQFTFDTVKPGAVPMPDGRLQAPHITAWIVARGINIGLHTRIYFEDETEANAADPLLSGIEHQNRVSTLLAKREAEGVYRFDIHLQGPKETIFFDI
ncbi:Protocatechuate 3,4-dioxygenase alpha chain [Sulfitobacter sp. THAF37]|uniref:protocatechuate 3,4-dioxygenase subunit alpha n=1 Tax=Sulfitobacter sp. THAF37 TaxID=2587855 RepID=UPI0012686C1C|nr:protocatechuate 3,4-dioxygenase subunit alpha [Sulfitobacter sp. THAF37]QFT58246.1 Protocatechuate 3,4-dioxygenase alpha chain [Sulfitobacter sp. THAF37]